MSKPSDELSAAWRSGVLRVLWFCLIYSPFVITGVGAFIFSHRHFALHGLVDAALGAVSGLSLFIAVVLIDKHGKRLRGEGDARWKRLRLVNILLVSGPPFIFGAYFAFLIVKTANTSAFEYLVAELIGGLLMSVPAYFTVTRHLKHRDQKRRDHGKHASDTAPRSGAAKRHKQH